MTAKQYILAIESSCDDTSAAVICDGEVLSNITATQTVHSQYGGVVPELASRTHDKHIVPVVQQALAQANVDKNMLTAVTFTRGPGLLGSLLVGVNFAKSFALGLGVPLIEVNHMEAHVMAHFAEKPYPSFPFLCLTVSGGHTQLIIVEDYNTMTILGQSIDDAAGEAFDKTGKLLGLPYPAGPQIDRYAQTGKPIYEFAKPKVGEYAFSFSGLKTSILYFIQKQVKSNPQFIEDNIADICASVQHSIVNILIEKLAYTAKKLDIKTIALAGGVSANRHLRKEFEQLGAKNGWDTYLPKFEYCTDNAAMIGISGYYKLLKGETVGQDVVPDPRLQI